MGAVDEAGAVRPVRIDLVGSTLEALLTLSRTTGACRFGRVAGALESKPCPAVPRRRSEIVFGSLAELPVTPG